MPRVCTLCHHQQRAAIDGEIVAGNPYRNIATRYGTSTAAIARHRGHVGAQLAAADLATGLNTAQDVHHRLAELQARLERLVLRLEAGKDHRTTLAGLRECREGLKTLHDVMVASNLEKRLRALEDGVVEDDHGE